MLRTFENYQRQLWPVIGALARRGFAVQPDEARDLIQDFYIDEWERLGQHYDPRRGPFERYLFGAFFQFARRRIARDYSQKKRMIELTSALNVSDGAPSVDDVLDADERADQMRKALERLPSQQRDALDNYLRDVSASERDVARRMGITRYRLRETLTDAVGRLAIDLDSLEPRNNIEQKVAVALWRDGMSAGETAALLGMPVSDVHVIRKRIVNHLLMALHTPTRKTSRSENMFRAVPNTDSNPLSLLKRVLTTRDPELLLQLRKRADEVVAALDAEDEDFTEAESKVVTEDPQWLAQVYEVLGVEEDSEADAEESEIEAAIGEIHDNQDREIAQAFQILTTYLPHEMVDWREWFGKVPEVSNATSSTLCKRWSELGAGKSIQELSRYGITPATFFEATAGLELLLERSLADSNEGTDSILLLEFAARMSERPTDRRQVVVDRDQLLAQMRSSPDCPPGADGPLLWWICLAAARRSRIFEGFRVLGVSGPVLAIAHDPSNRNRDLMHRWSYDSFTRSEEL